MDTIVGLLCLYLHYKAVKLMSEVWVRNRSPAHFYHIVFQIIEHSMIETLQLTTELERRQKD